VVRQRGKWRGLLCSTLLAVLALGVPVGVGSPPLPAPFSGALPRAIEVALENESPALVIDPPSWWMVAGNSTHLSATWADTPPACTATPVWYRWSVVDGWSEGVLAPTAGASVNFTAASVATGTARIEVRSVMVVTCGETETTVYRAAMANVTVVVPPAISGLIASRDPVPAHGLTHLTGTLSGGEPPYHLRVDWGNGNLSEVDLATGGPFDLPHRFASGNFSPAVAVEDSAGLFANATVEEPVYASAGFDVGIETASPVAEVGVPVEFTGSITDPPPAFSELDSCSDSSSDPAPRPTDPDSANVSFSCTFSAPGLAPVDFEVVPIGDNVPVATASLSLLVEGPLRLQVDLGGSPAEVGRPAVAAVTVSGGVPPFALGWQVSGNASSSQGELAGDGTMFVPFWPSEGGTFALAVRATDSTGASVGNGSARFLVDSPLAASATVGADPGPGGADANVSGSVLHGVGPFLWFVSPGLRPSNQTSPNGTLAFVGEFSWSGVLPFEGNSSLTVGVVDQDGAFWSATYALPLLPVLSASAALESSPANHSAILWLNLTVRNGLGPYAIWSNFSDGISENLTLRAGGLVGTAPLTVNQSGAIDVEVSVVDRLGIRVTTNASVNASFLSPPPVPPPSPPPSPPTPLPAASASAPVAQEWGYIVGGTVAAILLAAAVVYLWRRRQRARLPTRPEPDPVAVLRRIIEPADGVDRATVELMAEESGVTLPTVRATLDRLIEEGTLRTETGSDGEEVMAWSNLDGP
jgi:hypothetical protein